jgi:hypothetical protein
MSASTSPRVDTESDSSPAPLSRREGVTAVISPPIAEPLITTGLSFWGAGYRTAMRNIDVEAVSSTPQEFAGFVRAEMDKWARVVKLTGTKVD